tara:strand:- start:16 stop:207 length:192 start_codon:yes stop_codon:yes gene_type:complete
MQLFSFGSLYIGIESDKFFDVSLHLGNLSVEYKPCPANQPIDDKLRPKQGSDGLSDSETGSSN